MIKKSLKVMIKMPDWDLNLLEGNQKDTIFGRSSISNQNPNIQKMISQNTLSVLSNVIF